MPTSERSLLPHLLQAIRADDLTPDAELLTRFVRARDQVAFARLVERHGPMVLGVCRRVTGDAHAADDGFQATFLALARNAGRVRDPRGVAAWLYGAAFRIACKARRTAARTRAVERNPRVRGSGDPLAEITGRELTAAVDEEIARLPERYRAPVVLCCLDGLTQDEAARRLGWSAGSIKGRLERGREQLRRRLARRGITLSTALGLLAAADAAAGPPPDLFAATVRQATTGSAPRALTRLATAGSVGPLPILAAVALVAGLATLVDALGGQPPPPPSVPMKTDPVDAFGDPLPPNATARMGTVRWRHHEELGNQLHVVPSPTGRHVATAAVGVGVIRVFDLTDGRPLCEIPWRESTGYEVRFTPDGARLFYLAERGVVRFFDPTTGKPSGETKPVLEKDVPRRERGTPDRWNEQWTAHQLTKDGGWILTAHPTDGRFDLTLTEIATDPAKPPQVRLEVPAGYRKGVEVYHYTRVGDTLIGAGRETQGRRGPVVFRWDLRSGKLVRRTPIEVAENGFDLSNDGRRLVTGKGGLKVWDTETGAEAVTFEGTPQVGYRYRFSPDGTRLAGVVSDPADAATATATVWELDRGTVVGRVKVPVRYDSPFLLPDGKTLLTASRGLMLAAWDLPTGRRLGPIGHEDGIHHLAFSADGGTLFAASRDRHERVTAWDAGTGRKLRELAAAGGFAGFLLVGNELITSTREGDLVWADTASGREVRRVPPDPLTTDLGGPAFGVELAPCLDPATGRPAVFGLVPAEKGDRKLLARWDARSGELLGRRPFPTGLYDRLLAVSADGRVVARETCDLPADRRKDVELADTLGRHAAVLEDALTGVPLLRLAQPDYFHSGSSVFTPDGQSLVTWTSTHPDGGRRPGVATVRVWEVRSGKQRLAFSLPVIGKWWEFEPQAVAVSPDGRALAAARPDKTISVWDLATGKELAKRAGYGSVVCCLAFRPDGRALASGHADGTAIVWDLSGLAFPRPAPVDLAAAWTDLASTDAGTAYRAILGLAAHPDAAYLRARVTPIAEVPADRVRKLVADLDSAGFAARERARAGLAELGDAADAPLRAALAGKLSAEQRERIEGILGRPRLAEEHPDRLRALRAVEALGRAGSADARSALGDLAKGAAGARLTREAAAALRP